MTVIELRAEQTHDLRRRVLRDGTPSTAVEWDGDQLDTTVHLGVVRAGEQHSEASGPVVAISTWLCVASPDLEATAVGVQLRGMATDPAVRGAGYGAAVLRAGIERAWRTGVDHVWANARVGALDFYVAHGFEITSDEFASADTAIAHRRILLRA